MGVDWPLVLVCLLVTKKERTDNRGRPKRVCKARLQILRLPSSYLLSEKGGPHVVSVCSPDGHELGGAVGGRLVEPGFVQAVACSFVYGDWKTKNSLDTEAKKDDNDFNVQPTEKSYTPGIAGPDIAPNSEMARLSPTCPGTRDPNTEFDAPNIGCDINMGVPSSVEKSSPPGIVQALLKILLPDSKMARLSPTCPDTRDPNTEIDLAHG
ncbi:hypothetical protein POM88_052658 [Heracleum sosnowskyi]|uniref:AT-hook motif nuclear-localized protein n=1 Tax=Heracleum sosnowskyi TaxID=360622 RepID=A0AAD8GPV5_9APIA|nr:hypothetical protein POM88_052658 [Heracleum sosnowskyi]